MNYGNKEKVINVYHLIWVIVSKYRSFALVVGMSVLLGLGIGGYVNELTEMQGLSETENVEYQSELDASTIKEMDDALIYYNIYMNLSEYLQKSYKMNIDSNHVYKEKVICRLTSVQSLDAILGRGKDYIYSDSCIEEVKKKMGTEWENRYIRELVDVNTEKDSENSGYIVFDITAKSVKDAECISQVIVEQLERFIDGLKCNEDVAKGEVYSAETLEITDVDLLDLKKELSIGYKAAVDAYNSKMKNLTDEEKAYFRYHYLKDETDEVNLSRGGSANMNFSNVQIVIMTVFCSIVVYILFYVVKYCASGKICTVDEVRTIFEGDVYGVLAVREQNDKSNWIDNMINKKIYETAGLNVSCEYVKKEFFIRKSDTEFVVCGDDNFQLMESYRFSAEILPFISKDAEALTIAKKVGKEVLIVKSGVTYRTEIEREIQIAKKHGICISEVVLI